MIKIQALGGSGEDSRNCFLISSAEKNILLDCGVRREIASINTVYPLLTAEIARSLDFVLLSHCHEDHTAALPYLYELGYRGPVYGSEETIRNTPSFLKKWIDYVTEKNGIIPFNPDNVDRIDFRNISELDDFAIMTGKSGHILGGTWYFFKLEDKTILYTGDITFDSYTLKADELPQADILIIDCAYAGKTINQQKQFEMLCSLAKDTLAQKGTLLLPVPANGRGIDMCEILKSRQISIWAEEKIVSNAKKLFAEKDCLNNISFIDKNYNIFNSESKDSALNCPAVILCSDGMLTTSISQYYLEKIKADSNSRIIMTGHQAIGTMGNSISSPEFCQQNNINCQIDSLTVKVHLDENDVLSQIEKVKPSYVVLFHADKKDCISLKNEIHKKNITVLCSIKKSLTIR